MSDQPNLSYPNLPDDATLDQWAEEAIRLGHDEAVVRITQLVGEGKIAIGDGFTAAQAIIQKREPTEPND